MPNKTTGASSAKSRRTASKSGRRNSKIKKKQRDKFMISMAAIAAFAIAVVAAANIFGLSGGYKKLTTLPEKTQGLESYTESDKLCRFDFIDVGQGDSTLITTPSKEYILVDTGTTSSEKLLKYLEYSETDEIEYLILSHPHSDHIGGAADVLEKYRVNHVIMPDVVSTTVVFEKLYTALADEKKDGCEIYSAKPGDIYEIDGCTMTVIGPMEIDEDEYNNCSVSLVFSYGEYDALFTGDTEKKMEKKLLTSGAKLDCELYKVAHHGSDTSNCEEFISAVTPGLSVISCGKNNAYGHPSTEIVERLYNAGSAVLSTADCGTVSVFTDGDGYSASVEKSN